VAEGEFRAELSPIRWRPWVRFSRWVVVTPVVWLIVVINLGSAVAGYIYWYGDAIVSAPWYFWLFVPDSPLSVTFMAAALAAFHYGRRWEFLGLLATGTCMKFGLWTVLVWFTNYLSGGHYHFMAVLMSVTHFLMIVEGLILTAFLRFKPIPVAIAALFLIVNDVVDYASSYHPRLPNPEDVGVVARFSIATTVVIVVFWIVMAWVSWRRPAAGLQAGRPPRAGSGGAP
jgi:uncharacterized membrane protein YpjA